MKYSPASSTSARSSFTSDTAKYIRYASALLMIIGMVAAADYYEEKEIIFPEMAALCIGLWIVDKRVWVINKWRMFFLMTLGAIAGVCVTRYCHFPLLVNLSLAFGFAAVCLMITRTTLIPLISACMLPVLLRTESWVYPIAVSAMSFVVIIGQGIMEKKNLRKKIPYARLAHNRKEEAVRWLTLLGTILLIASLPVYTSHIYCILPPLIVTYVEFASSKAGFRNRPVQIFLLLVTSAILGAVLQSFLHGYLHLPEIAVAFCLFVCIFSLFEWSGKYFAPAGAVALIPMIIPEEDLFWFPLQIAVGAAVFIATAMLLFLKCYKWPKAQLIICLTPGFIRNYLKEGSV